ncbi:MAG: hypothetical protein SGARI_006171 [Bacillariaceae sp.]
MKFSVASEEDVTPVNVSKASANPYAEEIGVLTPLGFFDPMNMLSEPTYSFVPGEGPVSQERFDRLRWVELKHGRVAMLAIVGYLVTDAGIRFPGAGDMPSGFAAISAMPGWVAAQMVATFALMEACNRDAGVANGNAPMAQFPGDWRNGALDFGWDNQSDAWKEKKRTIELNNGRAAQMGILGIMIHEQLGNIDQVLPGH